MDFFFRLRSAAPSPQKALVPAGPPFFSWNGSSHINLRPKTSLPMIFSLPPFRMFRCHPWLTSVFLEILPLNRRIGLTWRRRKCLLLYQQEPLGSTTHPGALLRSSIPKRVLGSLRVAARAFSPLSVPPPGSSLLFSLSSTPSLFLPPVSCSHNFPHLLLWSRLCFPQESIHSHQLCTFTFVHGRLSFAMITLGLPGFSFLALRCGLLFLLFDDHVGGPFLQVTTSTKTSLDWSLPLFTSPFPPVPTLPHPIPALSSCSSRSIRLQGLINKSLNVPVADPGFFSDPLLFRVLCVHSALPPATPLAFLRFFFPALMTFSFFLPQRSEYFPFVYFLGAAIFSNAYLCTLFFLFFFFYESINHVESFYFQLWS